MQGASIGKSQNCTTLAIAVLPQYRNALTWDGCTPPSLTPANVAVSAIHLSDWSWSESVCGVSHSSELQRSVHWKRALTAREEGGAVASKGGEAAQRCPHFHNQELNS
ncbi:hypothetical protein ACFLV7_14890 [Chloroflexota bacterium]